MPDGHNKLIREVSKKYKNIIVVLNNGSAISLTFASQVDAIIETEQLNESYSCFEIVYE